MPNQLWRLTRDDNKDPYMAQAQQQELQEKAASGKKKTRKPPLIISLSIVLVALTLVIVVTILWHGKRQTSTTQAHWTQLQTKVAQGQQQLKQLDEQFAALSNRYQTLDKQFAQQQQSLQTLLTENPALSRQWHLVTVQDILQQAYMTLYWQKNIPATITLLTLADNTLQKVVDPTVYPIRDRLAQEITALKTVPTVDYSELLARLNAIEQQFKRLPRVTPTPATDAAESSATDATMASPTIDTNKHWLTIVQDLWRQLQTLVVIRHHQQPIDPILSMEQRQLLEQNLTLLIQQAQWAVLQHDTKLYRQSLTQAIEQINQYFDLQQMITRNIVGQLTALQQIDIAPELPDIHASLQSVQELLAQKLTAQPVEQTP
jgi:uroporphyrin-III C-methyltransferase